jgi:hypothetical protein
MRPRPDDWRWCAAAPPRRQELTAMLAGLENGKTENGNCQEPVEKPKNAVWRAHSRHDFQGNCRFCMEPGSPPSGDFNRLQSGKEARIYGQISFFKLLISFGIILRKRC